MEQKTYNTFCPYCDVEVEAILDIRTERHCVRGEKIILDNVPVAVCPLCGQDIGDSRVDGPTIDRAYNVYRTRHNMLFTEDIKAIRARYGMSLREFSRYLGFGEQTYASYENGSLPDELHDRMIRIASTLEGARLIIPLAEGAISEKSLRLARAFAYPEETDTGLNETSPTILDN
ncbi:type II TA system antitoxin MqsA family protein [Collinsella ihumii]|uniref:Type II toxin-antitoxin system MqsA family antitoxin n=1 Tax=Collinsella ihumii TaxID=1720204 RepID=A0AAW7K3S1_9ACTN|nr:type II TA system antitoxin MqsA family protein [Collinsella ihumii]MDN0069531.1 type II toxin-antitoxin system MqsA family antitoxin [Collinsella ihumii]